MAVIALPSAQADLKSGALRAIGGSWPQRLAAAPDIPTLDTAEVKEAMTKRGNTFAISSADASQEFFRTELGRYARLVNKAGLELP